MLLPVIQQANFLSTKFVQFIILFLFSIGLLFSYPSQAKAAPITADPQYVVMNFSDVFYLDDWGADEASWEAKVKPRLLKSINEMKDTLGTGTENRKLAWSTLLEYTDFPMDTPSDKSIYILRAKRMMELAEAADLPVFMPLNGFQWWNEVPELWNYWDDDGDHTPGCENKNYDKIVSYVGTEPIYSCKFPKLRDPKYRARFIAGYNPDNKWNVEWQDWNTPMHLNWRNWGSGGFQLAPPPDLIDNPRVEKSYKDFQTERFQAIVKIIADRYQKWLGQKKDYLFAGMTIGTEVSLNASVTKQDEFVPYGYRSIQDLICPVDQPTCGKEKKLTQTELQSLRQRVINQYLTDLSYKAVQAGLPKQRVYTHVWSESQVGDPRYANYFAASINYYARPTLSLYGFAQNPKDLPLLTKTLKSENQPVWGASEFSTDKDAESWQRAMKNTLDDSENPAQIIDMYNWKEHKDTPAVGQIKAVLAENVIRTHPLSEIIPDRDTVLIDPLTLQWKLVPAQDESEAQTVEIYTTRKQILLPEDEPDQVFDISVNDQSWDSNELKPGFYQVIIVRTTKHNGRNYQSNSVPMKVFISIPISEDHTPWWVRQYLKAEASVRSHVK